MTIPLTFLKSEHDLSEKHFPYKNTIHTHKMYQLVNNTYKQDIHTVHAYKMFYESDDNTVKYIYSTKEPQFHH